MITNEEWETFIKTLRVLNKHPEEAHDVMTMKGLVAGLYKQHRKQKRAVEKSDRKQHDRQLKESTVRCQMEVDFEEVKLIAPKEKKHLKKPFPCYVCKDYYTELGRHRV